MASEPRYNPRKSVTDPSEMAVSFGFSTVNEGQKQGLVDDVFHKVASRYDLMNDLMSGGMHRLWKDAMVSSLNPPKSNSRPMHHLDVAGGTGDIATRVVERSQRTAQSTVCDINGSMLAVGKDRAAKAGLGGHIEFVQGNAEDLPFPDSSFDVYTIAFGIRNVPKIAKALSEAHRVLKRGGRFMCLEFSQVDVPALDKVYDTFSFKIIPPMGKMVTGDPDPYQYLVESIRKFPNQERFKQMIEDAGFNRVSYRNYTGGIAALHSGWKY
ncbi:bifunctional demethylmenaquinone methyltransferase/2-methoxy-6-polyprenyl-1,4-benzoquinol methylase UbiE [Rhodobacteraceae bacterium RKSG542]|uniref:bifunctional demethylmenaquinone methyltransferase/2-methoxy-6-polyprenyl-1,4-benzoquinol methylase UbiE n=1 Tax=Pseudovibrio flavus TaxID=2529854 RepID=UPI0012BC83B9|nr:bifunctional demethylmenaquinone methyltransferase/2-methoxy-6-polyprenyl-1,4-benzoquinol methylase UbiE [Pseudovibrio flavus]MTI17920.1 bifunctional demethylmenaquinone methyltransferase/2-methoxy-6-polyprenyl-1,4-benzoquinol methylase UbiE [Pseudovibrio flavus]